MAVSVACFSAGSHRYKHARSGGVSPLTRCLSVTSCALSARARRAWRSWRGADDVPPTPEGGWLRLACSQHGGRFSERQVEEVSMVLRLVPTFCTSILYWTVYSQMGSVFVEQGQQMDCRMFGLPIPAATLSTFDTIRREYARIFA